jgi:hypothetical protein
MRFHSFFFPSGLFSSLRGLERKQKRSLVFLLIAGLAARVSLNLYCAAPIDDALISMRYARNIARGLGFVYNAGEHVLGATTPLWVLISAVYIRFFGDATVFTFQFIINLGFDLLCILLLAEILLDAGFPYAAVWTSVLPVALFWPFVFYTSSGMEMSFFCALLLLSLRAFQADKATLAFLLAGFLAVCRPEGFLWAGLILLLSAIQHRRLPWRQGFAFLAVVLPWMAFAQLYFGSVIPQSAVAKAPSTYEPLSHTLVAGLLGLPSTVEGLSFSGRIATLPVFNSTGVQWTAHACLWICILAGLAVSARRKGAREMALMVVVLAAFYSLAATGGFPWYGIPFSELFYPLAIIGAWRLLSGLSPFLGRRVGNAGAAWTVFTCLTALALLAVLVERAANKKVVEQYDAMRRDIGSTLSRATPPNSSIMLETLGYIGYYSNRYVYDLMGLVSPGITEIRKHCPEDGYFRAIMTYRPDYLVLPAGEEPPYILSGDRVTFDQLYARKWTFPGVTVHGSTAPPMVVFERISRGP